MKILNTKEFLEKLNIGKLNIRDAKLPEPRLLPDKLVKKYNLVFNRITNKYDYDGDVEIEGDLVKDGKLITDFGFIKGSFDCSWNKLTSLEGCPTYVGGAFTCYNNKLTSLEGCPTYVGGAFTCYDNKLTSLEGCPTYVGGHFWCYANKLTSLEGSPFEVGGEFDCSSNKLTSLEGCPTNVNDNFICWHQNNKHKFTVDEVRALCNVKNEIYV